MIHNRPSWEQQETDRTLVAAHGSSCRCYCAVKIITTSPVNGSARRPQGERTCESARVRAHAAVSLGWGPGVMGGGGAWTLTCVLCQITEALEWPSLFRQGPLS